MNPTHPSSQLQSYSQQQPQNSHLSSSGNKNNNKNNIPSSLPQLQSELTCVICQDIMWPPTTLQCGHSFCVACIDW